VAPTDLEDWFHVRWDDVAVQLDVSPPGRESWRARFEWSSVSRVCFKAEDLLMSDGIYVFTAQRPESYAIPMEADGGAELWDELVRRGLFDAELAIRAAGAAEGLFCWPEAEEGD